MMYKQALLIIGVLVAITLLFWYSLSLQETFYNIVSFFETYVRQNEALGLLVFMLTAALAALVGPFTNLPLIPVAVALFGTVPTTLLLLGGWLIGDTIAYLIGRYIGYPAVRYVISAKRFDAWLSTISPHTSFFKMFLLRLALPAELGYAFGTIRYPFWKYFLLTFFAELPFVLVTIYASEAILLGERLQFFGLIALMSVIFFGAFYLVRKPTLHGVDK
ncbi:MAG: VTT domain-containing protein [Patescibacteria group bacterium]|nr:VTT domain-containing protein [Patescibacteria group bacterium]